MLTNFHSAENRTYLLSSAARVHPDAPVLLLFRGLPSPVKVPQGRPAAPTARWKWIFLHPGIGVEGSLLLPQALVALDAPPRAGLHSRAILTPSQGRGRGRRRRWSFPARARNESFYLSFCLPGGGGLLTHHCDQEAGYEGGE